MKIYGPFLSDNMGYVLPQALGFLKREIERFENERRESPIQWEKDEIEENIEWTFERGINMMQFAKPGELEPELIDYFLDRVKERPDLKRLRELFGKPGT